MFKRLVSGGYTPTHEPTETIERILVLSFISLNIHQSWNNMYSIFLCPGVSRLIDPLKGPACSTKDAICGTFSNTMPSLQSSSLVFDKNTSLHGDCELWCKTSVKIYTKLGWIDVKVRRLEFLLSVEVNRLKDINLEVWSPLISGFGLLVGGEASLQYNWFNLYNQTCCQWWIYSNTWANPNNWTNLGRAVHIIKHSSMVK